VIASCPNLAVSPFCLGQVPPPAVSRRCPVKLSRLAAVPGRCAACRPFCRRRCRGAEPELPWPGLVVSDSEAVPLGPSSGPGWRPNPVFPIRRAFPAHPGERSIRGRAEWAPGSSDGSGRVRSLIA